jgi:hypothetical protein
VAGRPGQHREGDQEGGHRQPDLARIEADHQPQVERQRGHDEAHGEPVGERECERNHELTPAAQRGDDLGGGHARARSRAVGEANEARHRQRQRQHAAAQRHPQWVDAADEAAQRRAGRHPQADAGADRAHACAEPGLAGVVRTQRHQQRQRRHVGEAFEEAQAEQQAVASALR